jgi:uncharacterized DUF497 family protein
MQRSVVRDQGSVKAASEQRDIAIGVAGSIGVLFVVNTIRGDEEQEMIRIISARAATKAERREYARVNGAAEA